MYRVIKSASRIHPDLKYVEPTELDSHDKLEKEIQEYLKRNEYQVDDFGYVKASDPRFKDILADLKILRYTTHVTHETNKMYAQDYINIEVPTDTKNVPEEIQDIIDFHDNLILGDVRFYDMSAETRKMKINLRDSRI